MASHAGTSAQHSSGTHAITTNTSTAADDARILCDSHIAVADACADDHMTLKRTAAGDRKAKGIGGAAEPKPDTQRAYFKGIFTHATNAAKTTTAARTNSSSSSATT